MDTRVWLTELERGRYVGSGVNSAMNLGGRLLREVSALLWASDSSPLISLC